jgi:acetyl-CoA carboxylase biotin carboxylase subunit
MSTLLQLQKLQMQMQFIQDMVLSENSKFSKYVKNTVSNLLGSPEMIDRMGEASAKSTMIEAGVPCVPGSVGILESYEQASQ